MDGNFFAELKKIVGPQYVMEAEEDRICYSFDATFRDYLPDVIVKPGSVEEIQAVVALAAQKGIPVYTRGAGTGLSGGSVPVNGGIVLVTTRLNNILAIDTVNYTAEVESGVITQDFFNAVDAAGLYYPPDPGSIKTSTLGGNIAECAGGPHCIKYGVTRDYLLGLEVVMPDGSLARVGNAIDGEMSGPDWPMLICGSEGTLGIVTKITLRLIDKPQAKKTMLAVFDAIDEAAVTVSTMMASGTIPTTLEIMDNLTICAVENYLHIGLPVDADALLLIEVDGDPAAVAKQTQSVIKVCSDCGAREVKIAKDQKEADSFGLARRSISPACGKINPTKISEDATVPRSQIPAMVRAVRELAAKYKLKMVIFGHAGDGNLHPNILSNKRDQEEMERVEEAIGELFQIALKLGGTLSGEHGIGYMKAPFLQWEFGKTGFTAGKNIKTAIDPDGILNPGKLFDGKFYCDD